MSPWDALAELLAGAETGANVYPAPPNQVVSPAIVIRPDEPWVEPGRFRANVERYAAVCCANPADLPSAYETCRRLALAVVDAVLGAGGSWAWSSTSTPVLDQSTGAPVLAAVVHLTYGAPVN